MSFRPDMTFVVDWALFIKQLTRQRWTPGAPQLRGIVSSIVRLSTASSQLRGLSIREQISWRWEEVRRQHQGMDRPGVRQVPEGSEEQVKMKGNWLLNHLWCSNDPRG